ncbi:MAG: hypothetical protein H0W81_01320 [Chloroflexi bacterium]|nr:hypothetical protein [Chloroflexota bacterium]
MLVLHVLGGRVSDWSFILATPLNVSDVTERRLIFQPAQAGESELTADVTDGRATFTGEFFDSEDVNLFPPLPGTVTVTCR